MKTISNVVLTPQSEAEKIATERILISRCFKYSEIEGAFEVYEDLSPQDWAELLEEIDREKCGISGSTPLLGTIV